MNVNSVVRPTKRLINSYKSDLNIQTYGQDNLYPQRILDIVDNSATGSSCLERFQNFIEGNGVDNQDFSEYECNRRGDTVDDILHLMSQDLARFNGIALHVNYNLACEIVEVQHVPFQDCRLEEEDDSGRVAYINVHPDWSGQKTRKGRKVYVDKQNVEKIFPFNPEPKVVMAQIEAAGGIEHYKGQILWFSMSGRFQYPKPKYDKIVTALSTDEGLDNVKYRNTRNNFLLAGMFVHKKGSNINIDEDGKPITSKDDDDAYDFAKNIDIFQGDVNCCSIMDITLQSDEDKPTFIPVEGTNYDDKFTCTESSTIERIYAAFGQEPFYSIRTGKQGFSGKTTSEAYEYYNSYVGNERRAISRLLKKIFNHWFEPANPSDNYEIQPLVYINNSENGTSNNA
ncbi:hypothetical protein [uncultured Duncaniella sp.]|jgi:hypothetical protein|uniref:hypothetical protein n=1 Tax=uncultured Duncaniella sp. TaxID=2768039 RepID=UPI0025AFCC4E|nr:hypothetical protein [uncultured Duncaniella sp.]